MACRRQAQGDDLHSLVLVLMAIGLCVAFMIAGAKRRQTFHSYGVAFQLDVQFIGLPHITKVGGALERPLLFWDAGTGEHFLRVGDHLVPMRTQTFGSGVCQWCEISLRIIPANIGTNEAQRGKAAGDWWDDDVWYIEFFRQ